MGRQVGVRAEPSEGIAEAGAGKGGERRLREQKRLPAGCQVAPSPAFARAGLDNPPPRVKPVG